MASNPPITPTPPNGPPPGGPTKGKGRAAFDTAGLKAILAKVGTLLLPVALGAFVCAAWWATFSLGQMFKLEPLFSLVVAVGAVGALLGHAGRVVSGTSNIQRLLHGLGMLVWLALILFFSVLYFGMMSAGVTPGMDEAQITEKLTTSFLPAEILDNGRMMFGYAVAIGLLTSLVTSVVSYVMSNPLMDKIHKTLGEGFAPMALNLVTGLVVLTSALHVLQYGTQFAGVGVVESLVACAVAELTFVAAEQMCLRELKARATTEKLDAFDLVAWGALALVALAYMMAINQVYGTMAEIVAAHPTDGLGGADQAAAISAGLKAAHTATAGGLLGFAKSLYPISAPLFGGLLIVLKVATTAVNVNVARRANGLDKDNGQPERKTRGRLRFGKDGPPGGKNKSDKNDDPAGDDEPHPDDAPPVDPPATDDTKPLQQNGRPKRNMKDLRSRPRAGFACKCAECGNGFTARRVDARFCSDKCRKAASRRVANG